MNLKISDRRERKKQRGSILAMTALGLTALLGAAGLSVDINHLYSASSELQNAADMAAISAVSALNNSAKGVEEAANRAVAAMNKTDFENATVVVDRNNVRFAVNLTAFDNNGTGLSETQAKANPNNIRFVKVTLSPHSVNVYFASYFLGANSTTLTKQAVAGMSIGITPDHAGFLAPVQDDVDHTGLDVYSGNQSCYDNWEYTPGCTYTLQMMPPCTVEESKYFVLNESNSRATNQWNNRIAIGLDGSYCPNTTIATEAHPSGLAVKQAVNTIFDIQNGGLSATQFPPDLNIAQGASNNGLSYADYKSGAGAVAPSNPGAADRRIIVLPIVNKSTWNSGTNQATIAKYGVFFLTKRAVGNGNGVATMRVEMVGDQVVVDSGAANCATGTSNITVPVLYK